MEKQLVEKMVSVEEVEKLVPMKFYVNTCDNTQYTSYEDAYKAFIKTVNMVHPVENIKTLYGLKEAVDSVLYKNKETNWTDSNSIAKNLVKAVIEYNEISLLDDAGIYFSDLDLSKLLANNLYTEHFQKVVDYINKNLNYILIPDIIESGLSQYKIYVKPIDDLFYKLDSYSEYVLNNFDRAKVLSKLYKSKLRHYDKSGKLINFTELTINKYLSLSKHYSSNESKRKELIDFINENKLIAPSNHIDVLFESTFSYLVNNLNDIENTDFFYNSVNNEIIIKEHFEDFLDDENSFIGGLNVNYDQVNQKVVVINRNEENILATFKLYEEVKNQETYSLISTDNLVKKVRSYFNI